LPCYSLVGGVDADYAVAAGKTAVTINARSRINHRAIYTGTGQMVFHWVQEGKTQAWRCDTSMLDSQVAQPMETVGVDGVQHLQVETGGVYPAACLLQGRMVGSLTAPAVHIDVPMGADLWVFLVKSPWFPMKFELDRASLTVGHGEGRAFASLSPDVDRSVNGQIGVDGAVYKSASLTLRRTIGSYASNELVGEVEGGSTGFSWKPITRTFDLVLVMRGSMSESNLADVARGLGAQVSSGVFGPGGVEGDYVMCDGPATSYSWILRGHRGLLENDEDRTDARFTW
jgi:hypothetical protein